MKRFIATLALMFFLISFASASHDSYSNSYTDYSHPDEIVIRKTIQLNQDRYPTYDYRHGYTYRTTQEYKKIRYKKSRLTKTSYVTSYNGGYHTNYDYIKTKRRGSYYNSDPYFNHDDRNYHNYASREYDYDDWRYKENKPDSFDKDGVHYEYVNHLKFYKPVKCYHSPPEGKIIYRKCS